MNGALVRELFAEIDTLPIIDIHTHVNWKTGTAANIGQILSYHYYTELANSAAREEGGFPFDDPRELTRLILPRLQLLRNTVQYDWLMTISREYLYLDPEIWQPENWEVIYDRSVEVMDRPEWREELLAQASIERVFLTNQYDDDLEGLDTTLYSPCLRTEPFFQSLERVAERNGLGRFLGRPLRTLEDLRAALSLAFDKFMAHGMGYAALSTPANMQSTFVTDEEAGQLLQRAISGGSFSEAERRTWSAYVLNAIAEACRRTGKPFHLMIGVDRGVYTQGVPSGQDLFDSVNSLRGFDYLFNAFPDVSFPVAVLSDTSGLELAAASWIRHNVYPSGHWWYANQPTEIARELRRRLDVVPANKLIGYFSDAYYLEFILPKFRMWKFELALVLAERMERSLLHPNMEPFAMDDALTLAEDLLLNNPARLMGLR
jgi:glucuronate isomerase